jgi:hypothetical protein
MAEESRILGLDRESSGDVTRDLLSSSLSFLGPGFPIPARGPREAL